MLFRKFSNDRGVSIIGTVFTLIILGVLGAALVGLVASDQESRLKSIMRERAFYAIQAGFEFALREIKEGGYPLIIAKPLGNATFTVAIDPGSRKITVIGVSSSVSKTHSITTALLGKDCLSINTSGAVVGGVSHNELQGLVLNQTCLNAVSVGSMTFSWTPNMAEKVRRIRINGVDVYQDVTGTSSGAVTDISDAKIVGSKPIDVVEFSSSIIGKTINISLTCTDSSSVSSSPIVF